MGSIIGTLGNDRLQGRGSDTLSGLAGNDQLRGLGEDQLFGQAGDDALRGAQGGIFFDGGTGDDLLVGRNGTYLGRAGRDFIRVAGNGLATAFGGRGDDTLYGVRGAYTLDGGLGNDELSASILNTDALMIGGGGNDTLRASILGNQRISSATVSMYGGAGNDKLSFFSRSGNGGSLFGEQGDDFLFTRAFSDLHGGQGQDTLQSSGSASIRSSSGDSILNGGAGNDLLIAGRGFDTLIGGSGRDEFRFNARIQGEYKTIRDFSEIDDTLSFSRQRLGVVLDLGTLENNYFVVGTSAQNREQRFIFDPLNGDLFFDIDGSGVEEQVLVVKTNQNLQLTNQDIVLF